MTRRLVEAMDRVAALVLGVVLLALGISAILWPTGLLHLPTELSLGALVNTTHQPWWPWALAGTGIALITAALGWLRAHLPVRKTPKLHLRETDIAGLLTLDLGGVATAAAASLAREAGVRGARGKAVTEGNREIIVLTVTAGQAHDLSKVIDAITATCGQIATVVGRSTVATRALLELPKPGTRPPLE